LLHLRAQGKSLLAIHQEDLTHRTFVSIHDKVEKLAARGHEVTRHRRRGIPWGAEDEEILRNIQTQDFTLKQIGDFLKRPAVTIRNKLERMGLAWRDRKADRACKAWTHAELARLEQFLKLNNMTQRIAFDYEAIKDPAPGRSHLAIRQKLLSMRKQLKVVSPTQSRAWTPAENEESSRFMARRSADWTLEMFATTLNRSMRSVTMQISRFRKRAGKSTSMDKTGKLGP